MAAAHSDPDVRRVTIYTDGGAEPNPGTGGWGAVLIHPASGKVRELSGGEARTTNNRMELTAAIRALETLRQPCEVDLFTDSQYLRNGVTSWLKGWIARGWKRPDDSPVKNVDLWQSLAQLLERHRIRWHWLRGHAGDAYNERADQLATAAIQAQRSHRAAAPPAAATPGAAPGATRPAAGTQVEVLLKVSCARGRGGWAALVRRGGEEQLRSGGRQGTTANQLDVLAACELLEPLPAGSRVAFYTVSDYLRQGATEWLPGWQRRSWRNAAGQAVSHRALWQRLAAVLKRLRVSWPEVTELPELKRLEAAARAARDGAAAAPRT